MSRRSRNRSGRKVGIREFHRLSLGRVLYAVRCLSQRVEVVEVGRGERSVDVEPADGVLLPSWLATGPLVDLLKNSQLCILEGISVDGKGGTIA